MDEKIYDNKRFDSSLKYSGGQVHDCLTPFGEKFVKDGFLQGYGYIDGGKTGHFGRKAKGPSYEVLREALKTGDLNKIAAAAKKLPSVSLRIDTSRPGNPNYGFTLSRQGCVLYKATYLGPVK